MAPNATKRKLVVVGDGACGKTSLLSVFALGEFPRDYEPTVFDNFTAEIMLDNKPVELTLWDTAGQEEYERLRPLSYASAHIILICFSLDSPDSLENVTSKWIEEVREICGKNVPVILVGCKQDLREAAGPQAASSQAYVSYDQGKHVSENIGAKHYKECSALRNEGVDELFEAATRAAIVVRDSEAARRRSSKDHRNGGYDGGATSEKKSKRRQSAFLDEQPMNGKKDKMSCCTIL